MIRLMNSITPFLLPCLIILLFFRIIKGQFICSGPTYSPNSTYHTNLNRLLSSLSSNANQRDGFYNTTVRQNSDTTVYGLFLCRGDATVPACQECVSNAIKDITTPQKCPNTTQAVGWYDKCMIRYSDTYFFSIEQDDPTRILYNIANATDPTSFMKLAVDTLSAVAKQAAYGGGSKKFATKEANFSDFETIYSMGQCTPDISADECYNCLRRTSAEYPSCCFGKVGGVVRAPSCNVRYEVYPFYGVTSPPPSPPPPKTPSNDESKISDRGKNSAGTITAIVVPAVIFILLVSLCFFCLIKRRAKKKDSSIPQESDVDISSVVSLQFDLDVIKSATNNFSPDNKLGQGGFGEVYKGILPGGQVLAVKRLSSSSKQGVEQFKNEVVTMAKLQHRNLVRLLGFCLDEGEKILIYEFVSKKSLDRFLFEPGNGGQLNWSKRYKIVEGIARGLLYLHEDSRLKIIHRDLKASNILLDENWNPKISDFGMARIFGVDQSQADTNRVVGTYGYMAPEYAMHGQISVKSDIYSFGVLTLEIVSGRKNTSFYISSYAEDLLSYAWKLWKKGTPLEFLDPSLRDCYSRNQVIKCIHMSLLCVQESQARRPTIQSILVMLGSDSVTLPAPEEPAFFVDHSGTDSNKPAIIDGNRSDQSTSGSVQLSVDKDPITDLYPRYSEASRLFNPLSQSYEKSSISSHFAYRPAPLCYSGPLQSGDGSGPCSDKFHKWHNGGGTLHESASIDSSAVVEIGAVVHSKAVVGANVHIGSGTIVGPSVIIGHSTKIGYHVALSNCQAGELCVVHNGVCIGQDGFGFYVDGNGNMIKKPQMLNVIIGAHVEIGANTCIDRGSWRDTIIGDHTKLDNLVQIGHNVVIGKNCMICGQVGIAGSATIGDYVTMGGGGVAVRDHVSVVSKVRLAATSCVTKDILEPGDYGGFPAVPIHKWRRQIVSSCRTPGKSGP